MKQIDLKAKFARKQRLEIEAKCAVKMKIYFYNKFPDDIIDVETIRPVTEMEIRRLRKNRKARKYYHKNAVKIKGKALERYWTEQLCETEALNTAFKGCNAHHISVDYVVYYPRELHQKHPHSLKNCFRMDVINAAVLEWLVSEEKRDIAARMKEVLASGQ